jgi:two-component system chemotaxis sensor kinase CheA
MHLLTNALKFTERGEIALEFRVHSEGEHEFVEFSVSDTGIGIGQRDQEIVFEEFRQLDGSSTRQYGGTGLGLSLCQKLAQSLGGRIQVESEVGQGSTFSLILPLQRSQRESVLATANSAG